MSSESSSSPIVNNKAFSYGTIVRWNKDHVDNTRDKLWVCIFYYDNHQIIRSLPTAGSTKFVTKVVCPEDLTMIQSGSIMVLDHVEDPILEEVCMDTSESNQS
jgi:hypothetical protein